MQPFCPGTGLRLENGYVPSGSGSKLPRTPPSSTVSRLAACSTVSSSSQPPFGNTQPLPPLLDIIMTLAFEEVETSCNRTGMHLHVDRDAPPCCDLFHDHYSCERSTRRATRLHSAIATVRESMAPIACSRTLAGDAPRH